MGHSLLVGRAAERDRLAALVNQVSEHGGVLVLRGEAGVGKSALLAEAVALATTAGMRVLTTVGVHGERVEHADELAPAIRRALESGKPAVVDVIQDKHEGLPPDLAPISAMGSPSASLIHQHDPG